jgi:hypothetical protein
MQGSTVMRQSSAEALVTEEPYAFIGFVAHPGVGGGGGGPNHRLYPEADGPHARLFSHARVSVACGPPLTAGVRALNLALVTSDKQRQRATKRPGSTPHFDRVVQKGAEVGMAMVNYLILGLPDSSIAEMIESMLHLMERPVLIGPSVFYATPGTESYRQCLERGLLTSPELAVQRSTCFPVETPHFTRLDLVTLFRLCRVLNFVKACLDVQPGGAGEYRWEDLAAFPHLLPSLPRIDTLYQVPRKLTATEIGAWLLQAFLQEGHILGLRLVRRDATQVTYRVYEEESSASVLEAFRRQAAGRPVYGVKQPRAWTRLPSPTMPAII